MVGGAPGREADGPQPARLGWAAALLLLVLAVLHNDFWLWDDPRLVAGLPVGLAWHVAYCGLVTLVFAWLVRRRT